MVDSPTAGSAAAAAGPRVTLSILMPVYNEEATLAIAVRRVLAVKYPCDVELVVVDDGSRDGTAAVLDTLTDPRITRVDHPVNRGKGAAIRTAASAASGSYVIMCDADLEYAPEEIPALLEPVLDGEAEVVYGNRTFGSHAAFSFWYVMGNKLVTTTANVLFNSYIGDLETCFKLMPLALYRDLDVRSPGLGWKPRSPGSCSSGESGRSRCRSHIALAIASRARRSPGGTASKRCGSWSGCGCPGADHVVMTRHNRGRNGGSGCAGVSGGRVGSYRMAAAPPSAVMVRTTVPRASSRER